MQSAFNKENPDTTLPFNFGSLVKQKQQIFNITPVDFSPSNFIVNDWIIYDCIDFIGNETIMALHKDEDNKPKAAGDYVMETFNLIQVMNKVQDTLFYSTDVWKVS
ncbi:hypothetical protein EI200_08720 [Peribacillus simplex]|uniref:hypothetical protein n=1 Tax=Peribacillus simplex TaxID=1478 RepID=UPI000F63A747|nr:hypothetical protein [Peribacillus simplex]RRN72276.1 hypothetical protein EI200_08720 [Peribacillus simplex]